MIKKMKNSEIVNAINGIFGMKETGFPVVLTFAVSANLDALQAAYKPYEKELNKLQEKYKGDDVMFRAELNKLQEIEVEINVQHVKRSLLLNSNAEISLSGLRALDFMLED